MGTEHFTRDRSKTVEKAHGRFEIRSIESAEHNFSEWPEVRQIFHITRSREIRGKLTEEHTYGITSLTQKKAGAARLLSLI